jgi:large subunit ribosomal protein L21
LGSLEEYVMTYAIIRSGGKQFRVEKGATVRVPSIEKDAGEGIEVEALLVGGDGSTRAGATLDGAKVAATIVEHGRGEKIIVFKKKRRKQYKRKQGHRQDYTAIRIDSIG